MATISKESEHATTTGSMVEMLRHLAPMERKEISWVSIYIDYKQGKSGWGDPGGGNDWER